MYRVLLVDDEPYIREGLRKLLCWEEYGLTAAALAANGVQALEYLSENGADILITDIKMPRMDGIALMKKCRERGFSLKYIVLSGYTDFELVKEAVKMGVENYLIKPVDKTELIQTLCQVVEKLDAEHTERQIRKQGIEILRENLCLRWLTGRIAFSELFERKEYLEFTFDKNYRAAIMKIGNSRLPENQESVTGQPEEMREGVPFVELVKKYTGRSGVGTAVSDYMENVYFIFSGRQTARELLQRFFEGLLAFLAQKDRRRCFLAVGRQVGTPEDLPKSFGSAQNLVERYEMYSKSRIVWQEDAETEKRIIPKVQYDRIFLLRDQFTLASKEEIFTAADQMTEELLAAPGIKPENLQAFAVLLITRIYRNIVSYRSNTEFEIGRLEESIPRIYELREPEEILRCMKRMITDGLLISEEASGKYSDIVRHVVRYLEENYNKDLCMKTIAEVFQMNPLYLGRLFKTETGSSFTDYLNLYRTERSKKLLTETELPVRQIAEEAGYRNSNYFCTVFRKYTGCSPLEYRREKQEESGGQLTESNFQKLPGGR